MPVSFMIVEGRPLSKSSVRAASAREGVHEAGRFACRHGLSHYALVRVAGGARRWLE
jgi:hypothetical protein